jgi:hypothetical protein
MGIALDLFTIQALGGDSAVSFVLDEKEALAVPRLYFAPLRDSRSNAD